ncbi:hypothetical protein WN944_017052 [Citrus x changshan-huyou]|uniref:Nucleolar protein 16 n=1 Tax=Citrus x changshan-huyou TaxID=2935761 RepID=A0AAP0QP65_9ROSI
MGRSRRKYKRSRTKVRVGLPKKNPHLFKPAFSLPPKLRSLVDELPQWDGKASVIQNYKSFGLVSNPNLLGVRSRTSHIVESESLQVTQPSDVPANEFEPIDSGSDLDEDDVKSALGKKRKDGKTASLQPLTTIQRVYIGRLVERYGDDYQAMFRDTKLNAMQHSVATLEKLCKRYDIFVEAADQRNSSSHLRDAIYLDNENFYFHFSHTYIILSVVHGSVMGPSILKSRKPSSCDCIINSLSLGNLRYSTGTSYLLRPSPTYMGMWPLGVGAIISECSTIASIPQHALDLGLLNLFMTAVISIMSKLKIRERLISLVTKLKLKRRKVPKGFRVMYIGEARQKFVVPIECLSSVTFRALLNQFEAKDKVDGPNPIVLPCSPLMFQWILNLASSKSPADHPRSVNTDFACMHM